MASRAAPSVPLPPDTTSWPAPFTHASTNEGLRISASGLSTPEAWIALGTLTALEIVLGIDNIVFISILAGKLPESQRRKARQLGLTLALVTRIALLFSLTWIIKLTAPVFTVIHEEISGRDLVLILGGVFLIGKSTHEIHHKVEGGHEESGGRTAAASFVGVLIQIALLGCGFQCGRGFIVAEGLQIERRLRHRRDGIEGIRLFKVQRRRRRQRRRGRFQALFQIQRLDVIGQFERPRFGRRRRFIQRIERQIIEAGFTAGGLAGRLVEGQIEVGAIHVLGDTIQIKRVLKAGRAR